MKMTNLKIQMRLATEGEIVVSGKLLEIVRQLPTHKAEAISTISLHRGMELDDVDVEIEKIRNHFLSELNIFLERMKKTV